MEHAQIDIMNDSLQTLCGCKVSEKYCIFFVDDG